MHLKPFWRAAEQVWNSKWHFTNPCHAYRNICIILTQIMLGISFYFLSMELQVKFLKLVEGLQTHYHLNIAVCVYICICTYTHTKEWKQHRTVKNFDPSSLFKYLWKGYYLTIIVQHSGCSPTLQYTLRFLLPIKIFALNEGIIYGVVTFCRGVIFYKWSKIINELLNKLAVSTFWPTARLQISKREGGQEG